MPLQGRHDDAVHLWRVPKRGILRGLPIYEVPDDAVWDARNVSLRRGRMTARPGFRRLGEDLVLDARPMGGINTTLLASGAFQEDAFQTDAFQVDDGGVATTIVLATTTQVLTLVANVLVDITDAPLQGSPDHFVRFTSIAVNNNLVILLTNGINSPRKWDLASPTVEVVPDSPPAFTDWTTASDRVMGIAPPFEVRWCEPLGAGSIDVWPALNVRMLADTADALVAVRALGNHLVALYKDRTIWLAQGGFGVTSPAYWHFGMRGFFEGPASSAAVVELDGQHCYMTKTGRVALFDGHTHQWIVDGIEPILDGELDRGLAHRIHGVYNPVQKEVYFFYPRLGDAGDCRGLVTIILAQPRAGIPEPVGFVGDLSFPVSTALDLRHHDSSVLALSSQPGNRRVYVMADGQDDDGAAFSGFWQTGLAPTPGTDTHRLAEIEVLAERQEGHGLLTVRPVHSDLLEDEGGTVAIGTPITYDLAHRRPEDRRAQDVRGRFFGLRHEFTMPVELQYMGTRLVTRRLN